MSKKNKIAALMILAAFSFANVHAATIDEELAVIAAEQEPFAADSNSSNTNKNTPQAKKSKKEIRAEEKRLREEKKANEKKNKEDMKNAEKEFKEAQQKSRDLDKKQLKVSERDSSQKNFPTIDPVAPTTEKVALEKRTNPEPEPEPDVVTFNPEPEPTPEPAPTPAPASPTPEPPALTLPNPIVNYSNFEELAHAVNFIPLYIPKKAGFSINSMHAISGQIAEIRYGRRWEPDVSLHVRTYKRNAGEELKDISGVYGVKWRVDMASGTSVYIAKIAENRHVAAWATGDYTFSAQVENLSFAAFHAIVIDELVDLSNHYYIK